MTDSEQHRIIGKTISDHAQAKTKLAALLVKAKAMATDISAVSNVLTRTTPGMFDGHVFRTSNGRDVVWPTAAEVAHLLGEIDTAQNDVIALEQQRRDLGV